MANYLEFESQSKKNPFLAGRGNFIIRNAPLNFLFFRYSGLVCGNRSTDLYIENITINLISHTKE